MKPFNIDEYLKNPNKKVITRDGRNVKIHCTNYCANQPIIAEVDGADYSTSFLSNGRFFSFGDNRNDLFFSPEKHEAWINLYKWNNSTRYYVSKPFDSEEEAMEFSRKDDNYLKTIKIEWEE